MWSRLFALLGGFVLCCPLALAAGVSSAEAPSAAQVGSDLSAFSAQDSQPLLLPASDSRRMKFVSLKFDQGQMLKTNDFIKSDGMDLDYRAVALKVGMGLPGNSWMNLDCHKPYIGLGFYTAMFDDRKYYGNPFSFFLFYGGSLWEFSQRCHLLYEWDFGYSTQWGHYDPIDAPDNITVGASENAHIGFNLFFEWQVARNLDVKIGGCVTHFSNGATHLPNKGMNLWSPTLELAYRWDDPSYNSSHATSDELRALYPELRRPSGYKPKLRHDFRLTVSKRQLYMDTLGSGLPNEFYDHTFRVFQLSYAPLYAPSWRYAIGPCVDVVYDESNNAFVRQEVGADGYAYHRLHLGPTSDRYQLGLSLKGVMRTPYFNFFLQPGYDLVHAVSSTSRLYQIAGFEVNCSKNIYLACGIRAIRFSKAQFITWSVGYAFDRGLPWMRKKSAAD